MKKFWSKNVMIVVFALTNLVWGAYIVVEKSHIKSWRELFGERKTPATSAAPKTPKKGLVSAASLRDDNELQACYQALLARGAELEEGTVHVHMTINNEGAINYLKLVHSDMPDPEFQDCILGKIQEKRLPATADRVGVLISHKFNFHKREQSALEFEH